VVGTKLIRMFRLSKLVKLLDVNRVKRLVKRYYDKSTNSEAYKEGYLVLYFYKLLRLTLIVFGGAYYLGSFWWFLVNFGNTSEDKENGHTFIKVF